MTGYLPMMALEQFAERMGVEPAWLKKWLKKNPLSMDGRPHYRKAGRDYIFSQYEITLVYYQLRDLEIIKQRIDIWNVPEREHGPDKNEDLIGNIYFIDGGAAIKIGYTRSVKSRVRKMLTDAPVGLKILHLEPGTFRTEKIFHRKFADIRLRGEWFRKTDELMAFIEQRRHVRDIAGDGGQR